MPPEPQGPAAGFEDLLARLENEPQLAGSPVGAGLFAALALGISGDSRGFARDFGIAHALVLREVTSLADELGLIEITREDARTQRRFLSLTETGRILLARHSAS